MNESAYIQQRDGGYWIGTSRVSLDSVVYAFLNGQTAESIARSFDTLSLEQVYGAIAFYLSRRDEIDAYLAQGREEFDRQRRQSRDADEAFYARIEEARLKQPA
jgi:uncharacterized protein (DUF433 family)